MKNCVLSVVSASGIESVTKNELNKLGYEAPALNGSFTFQGDLYDVARLNMFLRTADKVYINVKTFSANTFDSLFDGIYNIDWSFIPKNAKILVDGKSVKSKLFALSACQSIIKKAIIKKLSYIYKTSNFPEDGATFKIDFSILKDVVTVKLNTSGAGLHKRGYRNFVGQAPIKETIASAMLLLSDFYYKRPLFDPFCGSGTIIIEGARIALNIASGKNRAFDYQSWDFFDKNIYKKVLTEALDNETLDRKLEFFGSDVDEKAVALAKKHALNAGVSDKVSFTCKDVKDFSSEFSGGVIVTNPPYGERLLEKSEAEKLYKVLGNIYKQLDNWSLFLITNDNQFERFFGKKSDKNRKLYNSNKECKFYQYFYDRNKYKQKIANQISKGEI